MLKRTIYLSFLCFYFASSYAVTQERVRLMAGHVQHSPSHGNQSQMENDGRHVRDGFPNYRQAKPKPKTICVLPFALIAQQAFIPTFSGRFFWIDSSVSLQSLKHGGSFVSRAPPMLRRTKHVN
jgi:hypothetical protein